MGKAPTMYDVAERAGVSIATVSFAFSRPEKIAAATREVVLAAADELGYLPNAAARGLAKGSTGVLGFWSYDYDMVAAAADPTSVQRPVADPGWNYPIYVDEVQRGFQLESWRRDYAVLVHGGRTENSDVRIREAAARVDGLVVLPRTVSRAALHHLARRLPIVAVSEAPDEDDVLSYVMTDNSTAMTELTSHLIERQSLSRLVYVGSGVIDFDVRFTGFQEALRLHGLPVPDEPLGGFGAARIAHQAADITRELILPHDLPDAVVCATDQHALVVMDALRRAGVRIPDDVAVTGFDGLLAGRYADPALTTVRQPMQEMGRAAAGLIIDLVNGPWSPSGTRVTVNSELLIRHSCGC